MACGRGMYPRRDGKYRLLLETHFNVLEISFQVVLANAFDVQNRRGHKTDPNDSRWLAHLLRHGMIRPSFIPPLAIRQLRDLTRRRRQLIGESARERNRLQKVLEDANVKLGDVLSDVLGVSGGSILKALLEGKLTLQEMAELAQRSARRKIPEIVAALEGHRLADHHRFLIRHTLKHLDFIDEQIASLEEEIDRHMENADLQPACELLETIPGVKHDSAATIVAEIGVNMRQFSSSAHLASWAGICPGNHESAGIRKSGKTNRGNNWLRAILTQCAWASTNKKGSELQARFRRLAPRCGKQRAIVALGHRLLVIIYNMLSAGHPYREPVSPENSPLLRIQHHLRSLTKLGFLLDPVDGTT